MYDAVFMRGKWCVREFYIAIQNAMDLYVSSNEPAHDFIIAEIVVEEKN